MTGAPVIKTGLGHLLRGDQMEKKRLALLGSVSIRDPRRRFDPAAQDCSQIPGMVHVDLWELGDHK